jgi:type I restriction enzyme, S subunit
MSPGITRFGLNQNTIGNTQIALPSLKEQFFIANFLDRETRRIDTLIEEKNRFIELLKEKRQALISHAVTKGLDPTVKMKDSGVEWLGEVPEHWTVKPIKYAINTIQSGTSVNATDKPARDSEIGVLKTSCVYSGQFDSSENKTVIDTEIDRVSCRLELGALIVSRMNTPDLVGAAGLVTDAPQNLFLPDRLWQITFLKASNVFVYYWTQATVYRAFIKTACSGTSSSMQNLSQDQFRSFVIPFPNVSEQRKIGDYLNRETAKIDALVQETQTSIELLKEHRSALISAAVTGKIDVREAA